MHLTLAPHPFMYGADRLDSGQHSDLADQKAPLPVR